MESSQLYGGAEECHSSESGWTMYLGSSIHSDDDENNQHSYADYDHDDEVEIGRNGKNYYQVDDSDDSMASDASSGPSHQGVAHFKGQQDKLDYDYDDHGKYCSQRKSNKQVDDDGRRRRKYKKNEVGFKTRKANNNNNNNNAPSESGSNKMVAS